MRQLNRKYIEQFTVDGHVKSLLMCQVEPTFEHVQVQVRERLLIVSTVRHLPFAVVAAWLTFENSR